MLDQALRVFDLKPDIDLEVMTANQPLPFLTGTLITRIGDIITRTLPEWVIVQGDTTTTLAAGIAAYLCRCKLAHVEAGLRSHNKYSPFPEELNRRLCSSIADLHFAPTPMARQNLLREGIEECAIKVTGNTGIDALLWAVEKINQGEGPNATFDCPAHKRIVLVTVHRRESFGSPLDAICGAISDLAEFYDATLHFVVPVHRNPRVKGTIEKALSRLKNVALLQPLEYLPLVRLMIASHLILTDSGGIQEEAPTLGKPVLVLRDVTERPEGISAGGAKLIGTDRHSIVEETKYVLDNEDVYRRMGMSRNPYGDGTASAQILRELLRWRE